LTYKAISPIFPLQQREFLSFGCEIGENLSGLKCFIGYFEDGKDGFIHLGFTREGRECFHLLLINSLSKDSEPSLDGFRI